MWSTITGMEACWKYLLRIYSYEGDNDEIYFRDYMNAHPDAAREYEKYKDC